MRRSPTGNLVPLDLEIEATLRRNRAKRRRKLLQDRTVASILEETHFSPFIFLLPSNRDRSRGGKQGPCPHPKILYVYEKKEKELRKY